MEKDTQDKTLALPKPDSVKHGEAKHGQGMMQSLKDKLKAGKEAKPEEKPKVEPPKPPKLGQIGKFSLALTGPHMVIQGQDARVLLEALAVAMCVHSERADKERAQGMHPLADWHEMQFLEFEALADKLTAGWGE